MRQQSLGLQSKSRLFHPDFPAIRAVRLLSTVLLLYVAIWVQMQVGFFWHSSICDHLSTEMLDIFVDCFFVAEICLNFFTGLWHDGTYHDRFRFVFWHYATTTLAFDVLTSVPAALIEYLLKKSICVEGVPLAELESNPARLQELRLLRTLKPLRVFKLLRLLKAGNISKLVDTLDEISQLPVFVTRLLRIFLAIAFVVHTCVCLYWLVKEFSTPEEELDAWMLRYASGDLREARR